MDARIAAILSGFESISLEALDAKAAMLTRRDNKYIVPAGEFAAALTQFVETFDVLEIGGKRAFDYATRYFDDAELHGYHHHHQGRRKRCKVRVRDYVDAGLSYLEIKLKDKRQITVKKRLRVDRATAELDGTALDFIESQYRAHYAEEFGEALAPVLAIRYERMTLVAREGGERMTIDTKLEFEADGQFRAVRPDLFIVETKSTFGRGHADRILRGLHIRSTGSCSKYCVGMAATGRVARRNRFLPSLRKLDLQRPPEALPIAAG